MPKNSRNAPKRQTRIFYRNLQCFEPSQGRCEQSLYRAQGHFCWYLRCFLRFLAAHNGPFLGQNGPANLKFGTAPPPRPPPPKRSMPTTPSATALSVIWNSGRPPPPRTGPMWALCWPMSALCWPYIGLTWPYLAPMLALCSPMLAYLSLMFAEVSLMLA